MLQIFFAFVVFSCALFFAQGTHAAVTTLQAMSFGSFLSLNNMAQYDITINTDNSYSYDSAGFVEIVAPSRGVYEIDGITPNATIVSVIVSQSAALTNGSSVFQMVDLQETHDATADSFGVVRVTIGGTARTSGNTVPYGDATYNGSLNITINF